MKQKIIGWLSSLLKKWPVLVLDGLVISLTWYLAYWLRFDLEAMIPTVFLVEAHTLLPLVIFCHLGTSVVLGGPSEKRRLTSFYDWTKVIQSVVFGTAILAALIFLYDRMWAVPRSVFLLHTLLLIGCLMASQVLCRLRNASFKWVILITVAIYFLAESFLHSHLYPLNPKLGLSPYGFMGIPKDRPPWWHWNYPR